MKTIIFISIIILFPSCKSLNYNDIDFKGLNKRSYETILHFKKIAEKDSLTFETDTSLNFKSEKLIIDIYGVPTTTSRITYEYPCSNILWILKGPLEGFNSYGPVLVMEWHYKEKRLIRLFLFIENEDEWFSICNLLYYDGIQF